MKNILFIFGTRPEAIKMAPIVLAMKNLPSEFNVKVCVTGQHREMLDQVLEFFGIRPDFDLNLMKKDQTLFDITADALRTLEPVLRENAPDIVLVQGDTTTAMVGSLGAYYLQIPVGHVEAGLRSGNKYSPFPEEINRKLIGHMADLHFAPTERAIKALNKEGIYEGVSLTTNPVIDALYMGLKIITKKGENKYAEFFKDINFNKKIILITAHRRESFGNQFEEMCNAIKDIAEKYSEDVQIVYPVHLNPNVRRPVNKILQSIKNIKLIDPLEYPYLIWLMNKSYMVLTDSGGIQEEAPALGKPVLVMRNVTERPEGVDAGTAKLVGNSYQNIFNEVCRLLDDNNEYKKMSQAVNPYGVGEASQKIISAINDFFNK